MELIKLINARNVLENFCENENISTHLSYWMAKFIMKTQEEKVFYANEMRKLLEKYSTTNDEGQIIIPADNISSFNEDVQKLENTDVEVPNIKFALSELASGLKISMKQMYPLLDFIDEEN